MKEEALKLADLMIDVTDCETSEFYRAGQMIRRLVEELEKPLSNDAIDKVIHELRQRTFDPNRWIDIFSVAVETIIAQREELSKQTKPLSDEEIWELHQEHIDEIPCGHSMKTIGFVEFARAIEERHGIK